MNKGELRMSTFEREMRDPRFKAEFEREYHEFLISEFLIEAMEKENISVRSLAEKSGVSPSMIQKLRSGEKTNISLKKLVSILSVLRYRVIFEKLGL
jgi:DNA-binding Xre family transcriptional regulator